MLNPVLSSLTEMSRNDKIVKMGINPYLELQINNKHQSLRIDSVEK